MEGEKITQFRICLYNLKNCCNFLIIFPEVESSLRILNHMKRYKKLNILYDKVFKLRYSLFLSH